MRKIGYASEHSGTSVREQIELLSAAGCNVIIEENEEENRPVWRTFLQEQLQQRDQLVVTSLSQVCDSLRDLEQILNICHQHQIVLHALSENFSTDMAAGAIVANVVKSVAAAERRVRFDKQRRGILVAKQSGQRFGRKPKFTSEQVDTIVSLVRDEQQSIAETAKEYSVSRVTVWRLISNAKKSIGSRAGA